MGLPTVCRALVTACRLSADSWRWRRKVGERLIGFVYGIYLHIISYTVYVFNVIIEPRKPIFTLGFEPFLTQERVHLKSACDFPSSYKHVAW